MKKTRLLSLIMLSVLAISVIFSVGAVVKSQIPTVSLYNVKKTVENDVVTATGKVKYCTSQPIKSTGNAIIKELLVSSDSTVEKGEPLATLKAVEVPASAQALIDEYSDAISTYKEYAADLPGTEYTVSAPVSGKIASLSVKEGDIVKEGDEIMDVTDKSEMTVKVDINESKISKIKRGQIVKISGVAFEDKTYTGTVEDIADEANEKSSSTAKESAVEVTIKINDIDDSIKPGYTAKCSIITATDNNSIVIPYEATASDSKGDYVFCLKDGAAHKKYIEVSKELNSGIKIKSGLSAGDTIIKNISALSNKNIQKIHLESEE